MSVTNFYKAQWTLLDKTNPIVTPINIAGKFPATDNAMGNLTPYRASSKVTSSGIKKTRSAVLVIRCDDGLFIKNGPILVDRDTKFNYLIQIQFSQPDGIGGTRFGELFRFEIGKPSIDTNEMGVYLTLPLTAIEVRSREVLDSQQLILQAPKTAFLNRILNYFAHAVFPAPLIFTNLDSDIKIPDDSSLKQDWLPMEPVPEYDLFNEIIDRLATPPASGGINADYYYYFVINPFATKSINIYAEKFGSRSSGVVMDVLQPSGATQQKEQSIQTDNVKYKNVVIARGANGGHCLPMEYARFASDYAHARVSAVWDIGTAYLKGQYVIYNNQFFKSEGPVPAGTQPDINPLFWLNLSTDTTHSPWTNNIASWLANLANPTPQIPAIPPNPYPNPPSIADPEPADYWGCFADMNIVRANYDRVDPDDEFVNITLKDITNIFAKASDIPIAELLHGKRVLTTDLAIAADWPGTSGPIAQHLLQYDTTVRPAIWHASKPPALNDSVVSLAAAQILKYDGAHWIVGWDPRVNPEISGPLHLVKDIQQVTGPKGVNTAIEFKFNFDFNADVKNKNSRWLGFNIWFPWPRTSVVPIAGPPVAVGALYGNPQMDFTNLDRDVTGANIGWNNGLKSENMGNLRGVAFDVRATFKNITNQLINGLYDIPFLFFFVDLFDRVIYTKVHVRRNGEWDYTQFDAGPYAGGWTLYDNRIDELISFLGYTFSQNFFFKQREYTGVRFDWRFVKGCGMFWQDAYDENFFYKNAQNTIFDSISQHAQQAYSNLLKGVSGGSIDQGQFVINKGWLAIDNLRFLKDAYASSESASVSDSRQELIHADDQSDYVNLQRSIAQGKKARDQFFPQFQTLDGYGDVRMTLGETFVAHGTRVPESPSTLTCAEGTFSEDKDGFRMQVIGVKVFVAP